ncbi:hypothetical protein MXAN_2138 [Myxococcus xanthus DK 1622]|uniref:Uncharacterized protein n=1 Tax=Myxococcus xanthus (strain DK1622) TaxID=246197 RepID=Q1DAG2_MYXXD|nr:hypothetical protein MXAN_2138 [Myxococcus xanthus DK 1622]
MKSVGRAAFMTCRFLWLTRQCSSSACTSFRESQ